MNVCWYTFLTFFMYLMSFVFTFFVSVTGPDVFLCDVTDFLP